MCCPPSEVRIRASTVGSFLTAIIEEGDFDTALNCAVEYLEEPGNAAVAALALESLVAKGYGLASLMLAHCALEGRGMEADPVRGLALLEGAVALLPGDTAQGADARCCLARCLVEQYEGGWRQCLGEAGDSEANSAPLTRAFHLLTCSVGLATDGMPHFDLARAHLLGLGTPVDAEAGVTALHAAADMGLAVALHDLGECHRRGVGVRKDTALAGAFRKRARDAGFREKRKLGDYVNVVHW